MILFRIDLGHPGRTDAEEFLLSRDRDPWTVRVGMAQSMEMLRDALQDGTQGFVDGDSDAAPVEEAREEVPAPDPETRECFQRRRVSQPSSGLLLLLWLSFRKHGIDILLLLLLLLEGAGFIESLIHSLSLLHLWSLQAIHRGDHGTAIFLLSLRVLGMGMAGIWLLHTDSCFREFHFLFLFLFPKPCFRDNPLRFLLEAGRIIVETDDLDHPDPVSTAEIGSRHPSRWQAAFSRLWP